MARTPRARHVRHRNYVRLRHSERFNAWLNAQATRLGQTAAAVFAALKSGMSPEAVEAEPNGTAPVNTAVPTITGTGTVGQTLTASTGTWTGNPTPSYHYVWKRDGTAISGATASTYLLVSADSTHNITVTVTATNGKGSASATSTAKAVT